MWLYMAPSFIFPDLLEHAVALPLPLGNYESGKLEEKASSDYPKTVNHISCKTRG